MPFARISDSVILDARLSSTAVRIYAVLSLRCDYKTGRIRVSQSALGNEIGVTRRQTNRALRELLDAGYVCAEDNDGSWWLTYVVLERQVGDTNVSDLGQKRPRRETKMSHPTLYTEISSDPLPDLLSGETCSEHDLPLLFSKNVEGQLYHQNTDGTWCHRWPASKEPDKFQHVIRRL